jgi:hypothetical protein
VVIFLLICLFGGFGVELCADWVVVCWVDFVGFFVMFFLIITVNLLPLL